MQNLNIIPIGASHEIDDEEAKIGSPPYIIAEGLMVAYYAAKETASAVYSIAAAVCPTRTDYPLLDADSKSLGTYQKSPKNQFAKKGVVISPGGAADLNGAFCPTAIYNVKEKKFIVYYIGKITATSVYSLCLASGRGYNELVKNIPGGVVTAIVTPPAGSTLQLVQPQVMFDKEENLYKLYYTCIVTASSLVSTYLATSKNGYDF